MEGEGEGEALVIKLRLLRPRFDPDPYADSYEARFEQLWSALAIWTVPSWFMLDPRDALYTLG